MVVVPAVSAPVIPAGVVLVQLTVAPVVGVVSVTAVEVCSEHIRCGLAGVEKTTRGAGFKLMVKLVAGPLQPLTVADTAYTTCTGSLLLLIS